MKALLPLLMYAGLFYLMMRFGCGAHMVHGRGGHGTAHDHGDADPNESGKDPVCGMTVAAGQGYTKNQGSRTVHFCSKACLDKFEAEPQRYPS